jgi:hypothetical protein
VTLAETQALFWRALRGERIDAESCFTGTPDLPAQERVAIYADMVLTRQMEALRADFPETLAALGEEAFSQLTRDYARTLPSTEADIGRLGLGFVAFCPPEARRLAAVEWARTEVFVEAEAAPLSPEAFQAAVDPRTFAERRLRLIPALRLAGSTAVWRTGFDVHELTLSAAETRALWLALDGATIAEVCASFELTDEAFAALQSWVAEGWVAALD